MATLLPSLDYSDDDDKADIVNDDEEEEEEEALDQSFEFGGILGEDGGISQTISAEGWSYATALQQTYSKETMVPRINVASLIAAKRKTLAAKDASEQDDQSDNHHNESSDDNSSSDDDDDDDDLPVVDDSHQGLQEDVLKTRAGNEQDDDDESSSSNDDEEEEEKTKAAAFFDDQQQSTNNNDIQVFNQLALSRPLLKGIAAMGFVQPTPIQAAVIPLALAGRDVCASAVTGSGKTAAFVLPILERLLHHSSKAMILTPTRELAAQCLGMMATLAQFTKLCTCLIVGGAKNVNAQAAELRTRPDIIVATPGRLLDHVLNSPGVTLENVEFLVLDEADRLLDLGFQDEVHELIKACPVQRQTLLFSATMNTKVDDLIRLSLKRPVRVRITTSETNNGTKDMEVAPRLEQEFVRVRAGNEGINREGMLLALLTRTFTKQSIVFFDTKATAHRLMILCGLCGISCTELHGNLTQQQRLTALEDFRNGDVDVLLATDLAARGLDIDRVKSVINFEMPSTIETYIHRIGRTARAGRGGSSCTLIGEGRRHLMKELIKDAEKKSKNNDKKAKGQIDTAVIRSRVIPPAVVGHFVAKIKLLEPHMEEVLQAEAVARMDRLAEMEAMKAQNIIEHSDEIMAKPQREWFASNKQRQQTKEAAKEKEKMIAEKAGTGMHRMTRKKRRAREAREALAAGHDDGDEEDAPSKPAVNIKSAARATKRKQAEKDREAAEQSIQEHFAEQAQKTQSKKKRKGMDAMGDSSLFDEEKVAFSSKKSTKREEKEAKSYYQFKNFDPDKKLGRKKSHHSFKSKSKYKRRK